MLSRGLRARLKTPVTSARHSDPGGEQAAFPLAGQEGPGGGAGRGGAALLHSPPLSLRQSRQPRTRGSVEAWRWLVRELRQEHTYRGKARVGGLGVVFFYVSEVFNHVCLSPWDLQDSVTQQAEEQFNVLGKSRLLIMNVSIHLEPIP